MSNLEKTRYGEVVAVEEKLSRVYHDRYGREMPDPSPVAAAVGYIKQPSMVDHVRALVARELSQRAEDLGAESFDEANDFDVGDDVEPESPYEALGREGELGPLPPEVANMSQADREARIRSNLRTAGEHLSKQITPAGGGAEASPTAGPPPPQGTPSQSIPAATPPESSAPSLGARPTK